MNAFIAQQKLNLGKNKCVKVHVGNKCAECENLYVHDEIMKESHQVKYLGDVIHKDGRPRATIVERINRGWAICGQIFGLLKEIPIGNLRVQIGLELRQAWLLNGMLFNSEVWYGLKDSDIASFVEIDQYLIRGLLKAHAKTPLEHLYLETGTLPVKYIIITRRLIYLKEILDIPHTEIIKKVYRCQQANPDPGDWCQSIEKDLKDININITEETIENMSTLDYKKLIKTRARNAAFVELDILKESHNKVELNQYDGLICPQGYLTSSTITNTHCYILFALRSHSVRGIKENFKNMFPQNTLCLCERFSDTQQHLLHCKVLQDICPMKEQVYYNYIYGTTQQQEDIAKVFELYLGIRDELLGDTGQQSLPGIYTGPQRGQARTQRTSTCTSTSGIQ